MSTIPTTLPAPNIAHADWCAKMSEMSEPLNMRHYRDGGGKDKRLWMIEGARRITAGMAAKLLKVELTNVDDERVNFYSMTDEAKQWWQNGREQNMTNQEILDGWNAMNSIADEAKTTE